MADKPKEMNLGPTKKTAKGAHGGGTPYKQYSPKYPTFGLGEGFKKKDKPGDSTENNQKLK